MDPQFSSAPGRSTVVQPLCTMADLAERRVLRVAVDSEEILLCLVDGVPRAYRNRCPHQAVPLHNGSLDDALITCKAHGWRFNLITGQSVDHPAYRLQGVPVSCLDEQVVLDQTAWAASRQRSEHLYVGRYGRPGWVSVFGAEQPWDTRFRQRVVVETARGLEVAELLGAFEGTSPEPTLGAGGLVKPETVPQPAGRIVAAVSDEQWGRFEATQRGRVARTLAHIECVCAERVPDVLVVDAELLWDERNFVAYFLGQPSPELGPLSVELSRELSLAVQFQPIQDPPPSSGCRSCSCSAGGCCNVSGTPAES